MKPLIPVLALALAATSEAADFLNLRTGDLFRVPDADTHVLSKFRRASGIASGNVELDADAIPEEAFTSGLVQQKDGSRGYGSAVRVDLRATRTADDPRPTFTWDATALAVRPRDAAALASYRALRAGHREADLVEALAEVEGKLVGLATVEQGGITAATSSVRTRLEAAKGAIEAQRTIR